jgi:hypothetical protein
MDHPPKFRSSVPASGFMGRNKAEMDHPPKFRSSVPASGFMGRSNTNMTMKQA